MADFSYAAVDHKGRTYQGRLEEIDQGHALERIKAMGLFPLQIRGQPASSRLDIPARNQSAGRRPIPLPWWQRRNLSQRHLADFTRELATLIEAGIPLVRGLRAIGRQEKNRSFQAVLSQIEYDIEGGAQFSEALNHHGKLFNRLYVSMCMAGEQSGALDAALTRLADLLERTEKLKGRIIAALFYPAAVCLVAAGIVALLLIWIIPQFQQIFADMSGGQSLPEFTLLVLGISETIRAHSLLLLGGGAALTATARWALRYPRPRSWADRLKLKLPIFGKLYHLAALTRFCRTLGTLLQNGVPVLQALTIVKETAGNSVLAQAVEKLHAGVKEGEGFTPIMDATPIFPATLVSLVDVGEQTGSLPNMLGKAADNYDERVDNRVAALTSLIEPIMIILLAVIVGSIVIAMFLPLIRIMQTGFDDHGGGDLTGV